MNKYGDVRYYSESKREHLEIDKMHAMHLLNAWRRYQQLQNLSAEEREVFEALDAEVKERGLDKPREPEVRM